MSVAWQQASYFPGQFGSPAYLIVPEPTSAFYRYPQACAGRAPKGEVPALGDPEIVRQTYVVGWEKARVERGIRYCVINLSTGERSVDTFGYVRQAQEWVEEQL